MIDKQYYSTALKYQKAAADNAFDLLTVVQNSTDQMVTNTMDHLSWMPSYGKEGYKIWFNSFQSTTTSLKELIDQSISSVEDTLSPAPEKPVQATVAKPRTTAKPKPKATPKRRVTSTKTPQQNKAKTEPVDKAKAEPAKASTSSPTPKTTTKKPSQPDITALSPQPSEGKAVKTTKPEG